MNDKLWYQKKRHLRDLHDQLVAEGFEVVEAWNGGKHLRIRVGRHGKTCTVTCGKSPAVAEESISHTMQQARRGTRVIIP